MPNVVGDSDKQDVPAVIGRNSTSGVGVIAFSKEGVALEAVAASNTAVYGRSETAIGVDARSTSGYALVARSESSVAVEAVAKTDTAVFAISESGWGIDARSTSNYAVFARSETGVAVKAAAKTDTAVFAISESGWAAVDARSTSSRGVYASSESGVAVEAVAKTDTAVFAHSESGWAAVDARSTSSRGIYASSETGVATEASSNTNTAVFAHAVTGIGVDGRSEQGIGIHGVGGSYAGYFEGKVHVSGDLHATGDITVPNSDCAEDFEILAAEEIDPGTVMVIDSDGTLNQSTKAYDTCVAGVISGAGEYKPGLVLGRQPGKVNRRPIALIGRVCCKVDADFGPIRIGDLLTTSNNPGHAMRAADPAKAFGAVIGKALKALESGRGMIPILVAMQ